MRDLTMTALLISILLAQPLAAADVQSKITLDLIGDGDQRSVEYACDGDSKTVLVTYINVDPNYLAIIDINEETYMLANTISASGVRYAGGRYVWWTKGGDADLFDQTSPPDSPPIMSCVDATDIP